LIAIPEIVVIKVHLTAIERHPRVVQMVNDYRKTIRSIMISKYESLLSEKLERRLFTFTHILI